MAKQDKNSIIIILVNYCYIIRDTIFWSFHSVTKKKGEIIHKKRSIRISNVLYQFKKLDLKKLQFFIPKWHFLIEEMPLFFLPLDEKKFSVHFKILQSVHARNRLSPQLFVQFLVESNSHQYESREWLPGLGCPYKGHAGHKYPL